MKIDGGCHCGYITYEAEVDPEKVGICHCTDCQKLSGSAFRIGIRAASDNFKMISGKPTIYVKTAESGAKRAQAFCPRCGSPIYASSVGDAPRFYNIRLGTVRQLECLHQRYSFGHAHNSTGCLVSPQFLGSRSKSTERKHFCLCRCSRQLAGARWRVRSRGLERRRRGLRFLRRPRRKVRVACTACHAVEMAI
jgi:hypothetical protein